MGEGRFDAVSKGLAAKGRLGGAFAGFLTAAGFAGAAAQEDEGEAEDEGTTTFAQPPIGDQPAVAISGDMGAGVDAAGNPFFITVEEEEPVEAETPSLAISDASGGDGNVALSQDQDFIFVS